MTGIIMTAQILLSLSILVGLHEMGHLLAAKFFGMKVEKFSIGFPPKILGVKWRDTEYSIGAIPLGGFVKISGMIDESLDSSQMSNEPQPWEFRSKPAWQRLIVMLGGIFVNVILGVTIFIFMTYAFGDTVISKKELNKNGIIAYELGQEIGFETGDKILLVNGKDYTNFMDLMSPNVLLEDNSYYTVDRGGEQKEVLVPEGFIERLSEKGARERFISYRFPFVVGQVQEGSAADSIGLAKGDKIVGVNGQKIEYFDQLRAAFDKNVEKEVSLVIDHDGEQLSKIAILSDEGNLGFNPVPIVEFDRITYSFAESIPKGTEQAFEVVWVNIKAFGKMFSGKLNPRKSLQGPIGIAQIFGGTWDWQNFWRITGLLSMVLAFMNLLPIPALDGGHVAFLTYEIVSGRKPGDKFMEGAQKVGMVILLALMVFVIGNDIFNLF